MSGWLLRVMAWIVIPISSEPEQKASMVLAAWRLVVMILRVLVFGT